MSCCPGHQSQYRRSGCRRCWAAYRRSSRGIYYIYDVEDKTLTKLSDNKVQEPTFSPDASKVAYVFENNIYTYDIASGEETQVTTDGKKTTIDETGNVDLVCESGTKLTLNGANCVNKFKKNLISVARCVDDG